MTDHVRLSPFRSIRNLTVLALTAGLPRLVGAFLVHKQPFGDAYCYIEQASMLRGKIVTGTLSFANLYGFWLPLYQLFCAIISLAINQPPYVARLVSALAGTGLCVLVYLCSYMLTASSRIALLAFLAIAINPFHLQYSAAAMTDVPHALMVMGCMYCVLIERWTIAACLGAAACLMRIDSWMLVALVPTIELVQRRKLPLLSALILASAPAFWLFVCWKATGEAFASFHSHDQYVIYRLTAHPEFNHLTFDRFWLDANRLAYSVNLAVLAGCFAALWLLFRDWRSSAGRREARCVTNLLVCMLFFFAYFGFIWLAYLTKNQSDIWPRYGLIMFSLGLPVLAYSAQQFFNSPAVLARAALGIVLAAGAVQFKSQAVDISRFLAHEERSQAIANYLRREYASDRSVRIFCDHPEVRVNSGIPGEQFYNSFSLGAPKDKDGFLGYLRVNRIKFLVIPQEFEISTPSQLFPELVKEPGFFEGVIPAPDDQRADCLYRIRTEVHPALKQ